jgi:S1-C subfamily serine protease
VNLLDLAAVGVIGLTALSGFRRGLIVGASSLAGLAAGAYGGARLAPHVIHGTSSVYPPLVTLAGAVIGSGLGQFLAVTAGESLRGLVHVRLLRGVDNVGGAVLGALTGVAMVWVLGAVLLYVPANSKLRREVQSSRLVGRLTTALPPSRVIDELVRIDPFQTLAGPAAQVKAGDPALVRYPAVRAARPSVVRVIGFACGVGIEGSGWVAERGLVVTNAHVVAGVAHPLIDQQGGPLWRASVVAFDPRNDLAVLRVPGFRARPLRLAEPATNVPVVVLGFPENGPFRALPGRLGETLDTFVRDAYGHYPVARGVTTVRANIAPGNSGGPIVDANGRVRAVVFARRAHLEGGFGVPSQLVPQELRAARAGKPLQTDCVG